MDAAWIFPGLGWAHVQRTAANCSVYENRDVANATAAGYSGRNARRHDSNPRAAAGGLDIRVSGSDARRATGTDQEENRRAEEMKYRIDESLCVGCGLCVNVCPVRAITLSDKAKIDIDRCTGCGACANVCKIGAIIEVADETAQETASVPAAIASGVATAIGAVGNVVRRYASSSTSTGSRRGSGMGRGGGGGSGSGGGRGGGGRGMNRQNKRRR